MNKRWIKTNFWLPLLLFILLVSPILDDLDACQIRKTEKAFRLTIKYQGGRMELQKVEPLEMILPLTVKERIIKKDDFPKGYFLQMFDERRNIVFRMDLKDPTVTLLEYEDPEEPGKIRSKLVKHNEILFSILTPAPIGVRFIRFSRIAPGQEDVPVEKRRHEDLGEFDLSKFLK